MYIDVFNFTERVITSLRVPTHPTLKETSYICQQDLYSFIMTLSLNILIDKSLSEFT